jgi:hypothetical protein
MCIDISIIEFIESCLALQAFGILSILIIQLAKLRGSSAHHQVCELALPDILAQESSFFINLQQVNNHGKENSKICSPQENQETFRQEEDQGYFSSQSIWSDPQWQEQQEEETPEIVSHNSG